MLDVITCAGCGRKAYAQLAHCPQCGREIDAPESSLNLPLEYTYLDEGSVRIYPKKGTRLAYNVTSFLFGGLLLVAGLLAVWLQIGGKTVDPRGAALSVLGPVLGVVLIFQALQMTLRMLGGLPAFYMGRKGIAFPHLNRRVLAWENIRDVDTDDRTGRLFSKRPRLKIEMYVPERIAFGAMDQLLTFGARTATSVPLLAGWPVSAEDLKDLILLGRESWITNGKPAVSSPTAEEKEFDRVVKRSSVVALAVALSLPILLIALLLAR